MLNGVEDDGEKEVENIIPASKECTNTVIAPFSNVQLAKSCVIGIDTRSSVTIHGSWPEMFHC